MSDSSSSNAGCAILIALALGGYAWIKIDNLEKERADLTEQVQSLHTKLNDVQEKATALETSSEELKQQMERFSSESWADVLPDAQKASEQVASDEDDLKKAADADESN